jgi:beta-carotene 15,15'-dioxygenase
MLISNIKDKYAIIWVISITVTFGLFGWICPLFLRQIQYYLLAVLVVAIGLPHGATDFLLFRRLQNTELSTTQVVRFFLLYLLTVGAFFCAWLMYPLPSFLLFIAISTYHFGQSNWEHLTAPSWVKYLVNIFWGALALGGSVLWHWNESTIVVQQLIKDLPEFSIHTMALLQWAILCFNILLLFFLKFRGYLDSKGLKLEVVKLVTLSFMLYFTPLLVGFVIYFTLWHSLGSLLSQMAFYRTQWPDFTLKQFYIQATPYTLLALFGLSAMVIGQPYLFPNISLLSVFIVFIACVTPPHILLTEERYK